MRVAIVGSGIIGLQTGLAALEKKMEVTVFEKSGSLGYGASGHNAGVIHVLQPPFINRKARWARKANPLFDELSQTFGFKLLRLPLYLVYQSRFEKTASLLAGIALKSLGYDVKLVNKNIVYNDCRDITKSIKGAIRVKGYGTVIPMEVLEALGKAFVERGGIIQYSTKIERITYTGEKPCLSYAGFDECFDYLVITAGSGVRALIKNGIPRLGYFKGVMVRTNIECQAIISRLFSKTRKRETKGGGIIPWPDYTVLLGPTFMETSDPWDTGFTEDDVRETIEAYKDLLSFEPSPKIVDAGTRVKNLDKDDFVIERKDRVVYTAGIDSPGFTASPIIAEYIMTLLS